MSPPATTPPAGWSSASRSHAQNLSVELAVEEVGSVTPASYFRYDSGADQYIYNADFRDKTVGSCWRIRVSLDDGFTSMYSAYFKIGK